MTATVETQRVSITNTRTDMQRLCKGIDVYHKALGKHWKTSQRSQQRMGLKEQLL